MRTKSLRIREISHVHAFLISLAGSTGAFKNPSNGTIDMETDDLVYTPDAGFCGTDTFTYTITDVTGQYSASALVTIDVICADTPAPSPIASGDESIGDGLDFNNGNTTIDRPELEDDFATTNQSVPVFIPVLDNDFIPENSTGTFDQPMHGGVTMQDDGIVYTPDPEFCGYETFNYTITDATGLFSDAAMVTVEVECKFAPTPAPSPIASGDESIGDGLDFTDKNNTIDRPDLNDDSTTTDQDVPVLIPILANDTIPEGK